MPEGVADQSNPEDIERLFRSLYLIRRSEERIADIYPTDKIKSPFHLSIGQEAVAVGVCDLLGVDDVAVGTYRGHALYKAKGGNLPSMIAELFSKVGGCAAGEGVYMQRIGFAPTPCPTTPSLEDVFYPNPATIARKVYGMVRPDDTDWQPDPKRTKRAYPMQFKGPF